MKKKYIKNSLFAIKNYIIFFLLISFVVTCCMLLFLSFVNIDLSKIKNGATITFANVLLLSLLCTVIDSIRRHFTIEKPVRKILDATQKITEGDFSVRIENKHIYRNNNEFDLIIDNFNRMAQELSGIEKLQNDIIANVSHELKTPVASIRNYAGLLCESSISDVERIEYSEAIAEASSRLSCLITNILKLNKLENKQIYPQKRHYNLGEQLRQTILDFETAWDRKNIEIDCNITDVYINADPELLYIVWSNLISNAIKFTDSGGSVGVELITDTDVQCITVKVSDTGCGMSPEVGSRVFEKFYQGNTSHSSEGNGLGLALVKRVVDIIGGDIYVESMVGRGSTFTLKLYNVMCAAGNI